VQFNASMPMLAAFVPLLHFTFAHYPWQQFCMTLTIRGNVGHGDAIDNHPRSFGHLLQMLYMT